jgi:hypothetical protein
MKRLTLVFALLLAALARFDGRSSPAAQAATAADGTMRAVTAANAFLDSSTAACRRSTLWVRALNCSTWWPGRMSFNHAAAIACA